MKKFQFKFEAVEKVRKSKEDEALRALGQAQIALHLERERKRELLADLDRAFQRKDEISAGFAAALEHRLEEEFIRGTRIRIEQAEHAILRAQKNVDKAMRGYLQARRQMRMIEILKEKAIVDYRKERDRYLARQQDDLYVMRAAIREREEEAS